MVGTSETEPSVKVHELPGKYFSGLCLKVYQSKIKRHAKKTEAAIATTGPTFIFIDTLGISVIFCFEMWLLKGNCPLHGITSGDVSPQLVGLLMPIRKVEDMVWVGRSPELILTSDVGCQNCTVCGARPFTMLDAELLGLRPYPPIPKRCLLPLARKNRKEETLDALDGAVSREQIELLSENYVPKVTFSRRSHVFKDLRGVPREVLFSGKVGTEDALEGLRRRLRASGLDDEELMSADLTTFPLLFWHVSQVTQESEEMCLVFATRLLRRLGQDLGRDVPMPPLHEMPSRVLEAVQGLHSEVRTSEKRLRSKLQKDADATRLAKAECERLLKLRADIEAFDREAYLEWGDAKCRPCCAFNFFNVQGCTTCLQAFSKGYELDALKKSPPDWGFLNARVAALDEDLRRMTFA